MNTLLTNFTEEKQARAELEQLVSQLEEKNQELVSECEKLRDLVNDLLPVSNVSTLHITCKAFASVGES